jgi:hypothetical protein
LARSLALSRQRIRSTRTVGWLLRRGLYGAAPTHHHTIGHACARNGGNSFDSDTRTTGWSTADGCGNGMTCKLPPRLSSDGTITTQKPEDLTLSLSALFPTSRDACAVSKFIIRQSTAYFIKQRRAHLRSPARYARLTRAAATAKQTPMLARALNMRKPDRPLRRTCR